jgi:hypothetical protein
MFHTIQEKLERYIDFLSFLLCPCKDPMFFGSKYFTEFDRWDFFKERYVDADSQKSYCLTDTKDHITHHNGPLIDLLESGPQPLPPRSIDMWRDDPEHGLIHGFFVGFIAFLNKYGGNIPRIAYAATHKNNEIHEDTRLAASCLLHDFGQCDGFQNHDSNLLNYFNMLDAETYRHTNPPESDVRHPLIAGDRTELRRFSDYKEWVDESVLNQYFSDPSEVNYFYRYIRPALEAIYYYRNEIWIRHGIDVPPESLSLDITENDFYPMKHWIKTGYPEAEHYWGVEVGKPPFEGCLIHTTKYAPWGIFLLQDCVRRNIHIRKIWSRDHFGAAGKIPLKDWFFVLPALRYDTMAPIHHKVLSVCKGYVSIEVANKLLKVLDHFVTIMRVAVTNRKSSPRILI